MNMPPPPPINFLAPALHAHGVNTISVYLELKQSIHIDAFFYERFLSKVVIAFLIDITHTSVS
jgi:hypothetical protein